MSLDSTALVPAERAQLARLHEDLLRRIRFNANAEWEVLSLLADGLAVGRVEEAKTEAALGQLAVSLEMLRTATVDSLTQLHRVLGLSGRTTLDEELAAHPSWWAEASANEADHLEGIVKTLHPTTTRPGGIDHPVAWPPATAPASDTQDGSQVKRFEIAFQAVAFDATPIVDPAGGEIAVWRKLAGFCEVGARSLGIAQRRYLVETMRRLARRYDVADQKGY